MNDLAESDVIEGEFRVEEKSGFVCCHCAASLPVGSTSCPSCHRRFRVPTPLLSAVAASRHPAKLQGLALILHDRVTEREARHRWYKTEVGRVV